MKKHFKAEPLEKDINSACWSIFLFVVFGLILLIGWISGNPSSYLTIGCLYILGLVYLGLYVCTLFEHNETLKKLKASKSFYMED